MMTNDGEHKRKTSIQKTNDITKQQQKLTRK